MNLANHETLATQIAALTRAELVERLSRLERPIRYGRENEYSFDRDTQMHWPEIGRIELKMQTRFLGDTHDDARRITERSYLPYNDAPVRYCTVNFEGTIRHLNSTAKTLLGLEDRNLMGQNLRRIIDFESGFISGPFCSNVTQVNISS